MIAPFLAPASMTGEQHAPTPEQAARIHDAVLGRDPRTLARLMALPIGERVRCWLLAMAVLGFDDGCTRPPRRFLAL